MTDSHTPPILYRLVLIVLLVTAVYGTTLTHGFVWDDNYIIVNNPKIEHLGNIPRLFLTEDTIEESSGYYRPITYISFALEQAVWGVNPVGYHLTNLILHMAVAILFYLVVAALFEKERLAFVAALIFALHPIAGETVNFLSGGRNTLLCACFALLSLLMFIKKKHIWALIFFTVAIFSKEFALLMPLVFLYYEYRLEQRNIRLRRYLPYFVPVVCYLSLRSLAVQKANFLSAINVHDAMKAPYLVVRFALNLVAPFNLKVLYGVNPNLLTEILCVAIVILLAAAVYYFRKQDEIVLSAFWFVLFLLPVVNIIPLRTITQMADRYVYFSLMGFALLLASAICRIPGRGATIGILSICVVYSVIDVKHNRFWKNEGTFFTQMTKDAPASYVGFKNLGMFYYRNGDSARAVHYFEAADTKPDIPVNYLIGDAYIFWKENMLDKAVTSLNKAIKLEPYNAEPYLVLTMIHEQRGDRELAASYRKKTNEIVYDMDEMLQKRVIELCQAGEKYLSLRMYRDAEIYLWQALKIDPGFVPALVDMGSLKAERGELAEGESYLNRAIAVDPRNALAHYNLAEVYRMQGRFSDAQREINRFREGEAMTRHERSVPVK